LGDALNILHIISSLDDGGAEGTLYRLCTHDLDNTHVVVSLMDLGKYGPLLTQAGISVISLDMPRGRMNVAGLRRLWQCIRDRRPDVVQTWMYHSDLIGGVIARIAGCRHVFWGIRHTQLIPGESARATIWVARLCAKLSRIVPERIICCAETALEVHGALGYDRERMHIIANGYDVSRFAPNPVAARSVRAELGLAEGELLIGHVARYNPQKDHETLLVALAQLRKEERCPSCLLVGTGIDQNNPSLIARIEELGLTDRIHLLGRREDIPAIMNAIDVHVMSSSFGEAFPNVLAEAMACKTPCVATDVGDAAAILGDTGLIVPSREPIALARAIAQLLDEHGSTAWESRCAAARQRIATSFSIDAMVTAYDSAWRKTKPALSD